MRAAPHNPTRWLLALVAVGLSCATCTCGKSDGAAAADKPEAKTTLDLVVRRVPDTNLVISLPKGWLVDMPDPGKLPPPPTTDDPKIKLNDTRLLLQARPGTLYPGTLTAPNLQVFEDPWLPWGSTGVDYLVAQRQSNQQALTSAIRHVEAEPSRRDGRPTYHIRDEWTVTVGGDTRDVSQEALLLLDTAALPDGKPALHGYTVLVTMEKSEFQAMQPTVRQILSSVRFEEREKKAQPQPQP